MAQDISDEHMKSILERVDQFLSDLRTLGVEQVQLESGYTYQSGTVKRHYQHSGRTIRAHQQGRIKLVVATPRERTETEGK